MDKYICVDIGGTSIKHGLMEGECHFVTTGEVATEAALGGRHVLENALCVVGRYRREKDVAGICVSTAGMVDCVKGEITYSAPLIPGYKGTRIKEAMEAAFGLPCEVENDVNCAGLAESFAGAAKGSRISLCLTIGTGIGGAIIIDNQVFHGFSNSACEIGYMNMPGGDFQDLAAASVLVKKVAARKDKGPVAKDGREVFEQALEGDTVCVQAIDEMADMLGMGIANLCYVLNPEIVVLGGGIMAQREYLYDRIHDSMKRYLIEPIYSKTKLKFAENQNRAGMIGAYYHFIGRQGLVRRGEGLE